MIITMIIILIKKHGHDRDLYHAHAHDHDHESCPSTHPRRITRSLPIRHDVTRSSHGSDAQRRAGSIAPTAVAEEAAPVPGLRVRLCLEEDMGACGPYLEAKMVEELDLGQSWLVALVVIVTLLGLVALLIAIKCVCQTRKKAQKNAAVLAGHRHAANIDSYKAQMFAIAADNQHPGPGYEAHEMFGKLPGDP